MAIVPQGAAATRFAMKFASNGRLELKVFDSAGSSDGGYAQIVAFAKFDRDGPKLPLVWLQTSHTSGKRDTDDLNRNQTPLS